MSAKIDGPDIASEILDRRWMAGFAPLKPGQDFCIVQQEVVDFSSIKRPPDFAGEVYLVQCTETKRVKIGWSKSALGRLKTLQTGSPTILVLLDKVSGTQQEEQFLHNQASAHRLHGEWFSAEAVTVWAQYAQR